MTAATRAPQRVHRSFLFAPGNHPRRVEKCFSIGADAVILDLEDAVPVAEKAATREPVVRALQQPRRCGGWVRVNALSTDWAHGDFVAVAVRGVDGIVLPKVERASDLHTAEWLLRSLERERGLPEGSIDLMPIIETGLGYSNLAGILRSGTRVRRVAFGAGDFTLDVSVEWTGDEAELAPYRAGIVVESRAAGLEAPLDTVWVDLKDAEGFRRSVQRVKAMGFQGKMCIHPEQVPVVNEILRPTAEALAHAQRVVEAFDDATRRGLAAIQVDGKFVDYPIVELAQRLLAREAAIAAAEQAG